MTDVFVTENFLLQSAAAVELYHRFAKDLPILDYHCHLPPRDIAEDRRFENLTQIWLGGDHYKWRAMRAAGVPERFITGDATDKEKYLKWAQTTPQTLGNPLYHWTHMELKRPLGIGDRLLGPETAEGIWQEGNARLAQPELSCRGILRQFDVRLICTTDDPVDDLEHHAKIAAEGKFPIRVLPAFRPDRALAVTSPGEFNPWVERLGQAAKIDIGHDFTRFLDALRQRHDFFHRMGCRLSDHGIETFWVDEYTETALRSIFRELRQGSPVSGEEAGKFRSAMLYELAVMDHEKGWAQQFHFGVLRSVNRRALATLGPDSGYDCIGDFEIARPLVKFLDRLESRNQLTKTILYNSNPADNDLVASAMGCFQDGTVPGKMQYGSAWWFLDQKDGIERQLETLCQQGLLSRFVGMLTDSRSFLSYSRHDYFRRILCTFLGQKIEEGLWPRDFTFVGQLVQDLCYHNAERYFSFPEGSLT